MEEDCAPRFARIGGRRGAGSWRRSTDQLCVALAAPREAAAGGDGMLVGAAKEVSGIARHQRSGIVVAVQSRRIGWTAFWVSSNLTAKIGDRAGSRLPNGSGSTGECSEKPREGVDGNMH